MEKIVDNSHLKVRGSWNSLWKVKVPAKVRFMAWKARRDCLPTRVRLRDKYVDCPFYVFVVILILKIAGIFLLIVN